MDRKKGLSRAKEILVYSDSEPNEVLIGTLHCAILPFALFELGKPWALLQVGAHVAGLFQLYAVLYCGCIKRRSVAVKVAALISVATVVNYSLAGLMRGSNLGWLLILVFACWNVTRVEREKIGRYV